MKTELAIIAICIIGLMITGCSSRYAHITRPDGTEILINIDEMISDKKVGKIEITADKETGAYTFTISNYNSETSPVLQDMLRMAYEAGKAAAVPVP